MCHATFSLHLCLNDVEKCQSLWKTIFNLILLLNTEASFIEKSTNNSLNVGISLPTGISHGIVLSAICLLS